MSGRWAVSLLVAVVAALAACAPEGVRRMDLTLKQQSAFAARRSELAVAIVVPPSTRSLQGVTATVLPMCSGTPQFAPAPIGDHFRQTLEYRAGTMFRSVTPAQRPGDAASSANAIFEAELLGIALEVGCGFNFHYFATATGTLRAVTPDGREIWRSPITGKRMELPHRGDDEAVPAFWGRIVGDVVAGLVDDWLAELGRQPETAFVFDAKAFIADTRPAATAPAAQAPRPGALDLRFPRGPERPDDIAVIIGNGDYSRQGRDIPDVRPAHADAAAMRRYAVEALGIREGNVIFLEDATGSQMSRIFGSDKDHRGQLFDWVKPGRSRVFVYYAGHGAPGFSGGSPYLVPADADSGRIELSAYPLAVLYRNLAKLPAESVTVVLEACFSGLSQGGSVLGKASPVYVRVKAPSVPSGLTLIAAGAADQVASWERDESHGLFTKYFLLGQSGAADQAPHGNADGKITVDELERYLADTVTYFARRYYGRDQKAQIVSGHRE